MADSKAIVSCKVPQDLADRAKEAAARAGVSVNSFLRSALEALAALPEDDCPQGVEAFLLPGESAQAVRCGMCQGETVSSALDDLVHREIIGR